MDIELFGVKLTEKLLQKYIIVAKRNLGVNIAKKYLQALQNCRLGKSTPDHKWAFYYTFLFLRGVSD